MPKLFLGSRAQGFTIVELLIVIVVVGILATLGIVAYNGVTNRARDNAVLSDAEAVATEVTFYGVNNDGEYGSAVEWYSGGSANANISFVPSSGNVIDISTSDTEYCIRVYNVAASTYKDLFSAAIRESSVGICDSLEPSAEAIADNPSLPTRLVGAGDLDTCVVGLDNLAYCWGYNYYGQLGDGTNTNSLTPVVVSTSGVLGGKTIKAISLGDSHTCVIASDDQVYCWGRNSNYGQLGNGTNTNSNIPVAVSTSGVLSGKTVKAISAGSDYTCVIASDNQAYCWGRGTGGQLGNGTNTNSNIPVAVSTSGVLSGKTIKAINSGDAQTCAIASDNLAYCWGIGTSGELGNGTNTNSNIPVAVSTSGVLSGKTIKAISVGWLFACAIASDNLAYCWGYNDSGNLGNGTYTDSNVPVAVSTSGVLSGKTIKAIENGWGYASTCAIASDNLAYCWGDNGYGQLGDGTYSHSVVPVAVSTSGVLSGKTIKAISIGYEHTCAIASDDQPYCWGSGGRGALGTGTTDDSNIPVSAYPVPL
jgi:prepilin-type N-terminal cleavage/methylation domain-containing protein